MKSVLLSSAFAVALLGVSALPSAALTIPLTTVSTPPGASIPLGSTSFDTIVLTSGSSPLSFNDFFNFTPSASGTLSANALEGTSAGSNVVSPFTIELFQVGNPIPLSSSSVINTSGSTENVQLSGVALTGGVDYYVEVFGTLAANLTNVHIDGNVTLSATPLPGALVLFGSALFGLWGWMRGRVATA